MLGRLERVDLRDYWKDEARDFTPWLAQENNIRALGEALGLELETERSEVGVGPYWADILCRDLATDSVVVIENQLERTNHSHLGQLLTYASGLEASVVIWVAASFTEEHRSALDWLNRSTIEGTHFFGVEIELWRIGDSVPAPRFNIICKPNEWQKSLPRGSGAISEAKLAQLAFWESFTAFLRDAGEKHVPEPGPKYYYRFATARPGIRISAIASHWDSETAKWEPEIRVQLELKGGEAADLYASLEQDKEAIETEIGEKLVWYGSEEIARKRIFARTSADFTDEDQWKQQHEWLLRIIRQFRKVFLPRLGAF